MPKFTLNFVGGEWVEPLSTDTLAVINPATEQVIAEVPSGNAADIDRAVRAADAAFSSWAAQTPEFRADILVRTADVLDARREEMAQTITAEIGAPITASRTAHVDAAIRHLRIAARLITTDDPTEHIAHSVVVHEPIGVVGAITPWNYPLTLSIGKIAYALAVGNTIVFKPSQVSPLNAWILAEAFEEAGIPAGVFNVVSGTGSVAGSELAAHPLVSMVTFTGSTQVGKIIAATAASQIKRVGLELGGKSPSVVLDDADLERAVRSTVRDVVRNCGQTCAAQTRLIVPRERLAEVEKYAADELTHVVLGDPLDEATTLGPLASKDQLIRVNGYVKQATEEGARLIAGGEPADAPNGVGYFVTPAIFSGVTTDMTLHREEVFGPVLAIEAYDDEEDAVRIANDSEFGLAAGVWSNDPERAMRIAKRIQAGQVHLNGAAFNPEAPFGGFKQSGIGREFGSHGLSEFTELKSIQVA